MSVCDRIEARSMVLAALPDSDGERTAARSHAVTCPDCARALHEGDLLLELVAAGLRPDAPDAALARTERAVLDAWDKESAPGVLSGAAAIGLFAVLCLSAGGQLVHDAGSWAVAAVAASLAALVPSFPSLKRRTVPILLGVSFALALIAFAGAPVPSRSAHPGVSCLAVELVASLLAVALSSVANGRAGVAAALALAAQSALHLSCPVRGAMLHLMIFHAGGVLAAAALASRIQFRRTT